MLNLLPIGRLIVVCYLSYYALKKKEKICPTMLVTVWSLHTGVFLIQVCTSCVESQDGCILGRPVSSWDGSFNVGEWERMSLSKHLVKNCSGYHC